jgi:hypothetical protein
MPNGGHHQPKEAKIIRHQSSDINHQSKKTKKGSSS